MAPIVVQQTQPFHQTVWSSVPIMGTIERPLVQQNILVKTLLKILSFAISHYTTAIQLAIVATILVMFATTNLILYNFGSYGCVCN